jgi:hypothetical protein
MLFLPRRRLVGVGVGGRLPAVVGDLAVQHAVANPQPQAAVPGAVPDGVGGQLVRHGYQVIQPGAG